MRSSTATLAAWMAWRNRSVSCKPRLCKSLVMQGPSLQQIHNDLHHLTMAVWFKLPCRTLKQAFMGGKNLAGTGVTHTLRLPCAKSASVRVIADGSAYGLLVIWHSTQSPLPESANTRAGRSLLAVRSENGNGNKITWRIANGPMRHPPLHAANLAPRQLRSKLRRTVQCQRILAHL